MTALYADASLPQNRLFFSPKPTILLHSQWACCRYSPSGIYISRESGKKWEGVFYSLSGTALKQYLKVCILHPPFKFQYHRIRLPDTFFLTFFYKKPGFVSFRFDFVQLTYMALCLCSQLPVLVQNFCKLSPCIDPTAEQRDAFHPFELFVGIIAVTLRKPNIITEEFTGTFPLRLPRS